MPRIRDVALVVIFFIAVLPPAYAGGHLEFGHWVVTSDKREAQFYACIDNAPKMSQELEQCVNNRDDLMSGKCDAELSRALPN